MLLRRAVAASLALRCARRGVVTSPFPDVRLTSGHYLDFALEHADSFGARAALIDGETGLRVPYSDLRPLTARVASGLAKRGFGRGQALTVFASNCWEAVLVYHGALGAGGRVHLVNCHSTPHELTAQLRHVRPSLLLATHDRVAVAAEAARAAGGVRDIFVAGGAADGCVPVSQLLEDDASACPWGAQEVDGSETALLPNSSGTSGLPKTVCLSHDNLRANVAQAEPLFALRPGAETLLACLPFYHVYSPVLLYAFALRAGATVVVLPRFEPQAMLRCVEQFGVTFLHLVPPLVLFLMHSPLVAEFDLRSVSRSFSAAAPLHEDTHLEFVRKFSGSQPEFDLVQGYGMTELSPLSHMSPPRSQRPGEKAGMSGVLIPNTECRVLRVGTEEELGPMEEGEIVVRGPQVMQGYLNDEKATRDLIRDGWVYTGDIGYYDEDGYFFISDRVKELIKYKGNQVAPVEIEDLLLTHPAVSDAAVVGKKDDRAGELPTAFVVRTGEATEEDLFAFVAEKLSRTKWLHGGVIFVDEIPKSPSGKILRRMLRERLNG